MKVRTQRVERRGEVYVRASEVGNSRYNTVLVEWNYRLDAEGMHTFAARRLGDKSRGFTRAVRDPGGDHADGYVFDVARVGTRIIG